MNELTTAATGGMKEKLIELIQSSVGGCARNWAEVIADSILSDGWIRPPCKVGDAVWCIVKDLNRVLEGKIRRITIYDNCSNVYCGVNGYFEQVYNDMEFKRNVFPTKEEAKRALKGGVQE